MYLNLNFGMSIKSRFCPKCGTGVSSLVDGLCSDCYVAKAGVHLPKSAEIKVCKKCKCINLEGIWVDSSLSPEHHLQQILISKVVLPEDALLESLKIENLKEGLVKVVYSLGGKKFTETVFSNLRINIVACKECSQRAGKAYMGVLQIRARTNVRKLTDEVLAFVEKKYKTSVVKVEEQAQGADIQILSKDAARHLASELRKKFNLRMRTSHEQSGWEKIKCRPKSRINILLEQRQ